MFAPRSTLALAALMLAAPMAAHAAPAAVMAADDAFHATTLNLQAEGQVKAVPDQAIITLGVQVNGKTAADAMRLNRERMATTIAALKAGGIEAKDIQTSGLNLNAQYLYVANQAPKLDGYQAANQVTVTVRDIARVGATVDAVTAAGANQISGIEFGLANPRTVEDEARRQAVKTLQARADLYAGAAGMKLGRLVNLSEGGGYQPQPMMRTFAAAKMSASAPTPVEPGELTIRVEVSAVYELTR
jgi:uncharacterized protein YggE